MFNIKKRMLSNLNVFQMARLDVKLAITVNRSTLIIYLQNIIVGYL